MRWQGRKADVRPGLALHVQIGARRSVTIVPTIQNHASERETIPTQQAYELSRQHHRRGYCLIERRPFVVEQPESLVESTVCTPLSSCI